MDVEAIKQKILEDKNKGTSSYRRYPVRFLFMEMNNHTQEDIQELVKSGNGELLDLSDYLMKKDDGWMTKTKFIHVIRPLINDFLRKMAKFRHQENQDVSAGTRIRFFIDKPAAMISFPRAVIKYL